MKKPSSIPVWLWKKVLANKLTDSTCWQYFVSICKADYAVRGKSRAQVVKEIKAAYWAHP